MNGKDTIHHGTQQACILGRHHICHHVRTISKKSSGKCLGVIIKRSYQAASEDSRWVYEAVSDLWLDIEPASDYSVDGSSDKGSTDHENLDDQEQKVV